MKLPLTVLAIDSACGPAAAASANWLAEAELHFASIPRNFRIKPAALRASVRPPHHRYRPFRA